MGGRRKENPRTEDPMKDVEVGKDKKKRYENVYQEKAFKRQIIYTILHARDYYQHVTGCTDKEAEIYKEVIEDYFKGVSRAIIHDNYPYLWHRIGEFYISKFNGSPLLDSRKSAEVHQTVSFVNLHTSGWVYQFYWGTTRSVFHNNLIYEFKAIEGRDTEIGRKGLSNLIRKLHADKELTDYNAYVRNHAMAYRRRKRREAEQEKERQRQIERNKKLLIF